MSERKVQRWLYNKLRTSSKIALPNYTPLGWFECDLFAVTKAGLFHEYEIKLTIADFRADAKKRRQEYIQAARIEDGVRLEKAGGELKSALLMEGSTKGPSKFWYVAPKGMIGLDDIPPWAGLKEIHDLRNHWLRFTVARPAPVLHRTKLDEQITKHALSVCYYRYWKERSRVDELARKLKSRA